MKKIVSMVLLSVTLFSCGGGDDRSENIDSNSQEQSKIAQNYISEILQVMKDNAITKYEVDWGNLETEVNTLSLNAKSIKETYPAIVKALELLNTNHSFLISSSGETVAYFSNLSCTQSFNIVEPQIDNIGYIRVDSFSSSSGTSSEYFATSIQQEISQQDSAALIGWIVDLRDNSGGNMWPMVAGLGPFFSGDSLGYFLDADEQMSNWGYRNGSSHIEGREIVSVEQPYTLINQLPKIAVLSSQRVASSGEATLISFKKQSNVRIFGTDSCGLSTSNQSYTLSDGSRLFLTTGIMADRDQIKYGNKVPVDQIEVQSDVVSKAIEWLQN